MLAPYYIMLCTPQVKLADTLEEHLSHCDDALLQWGKRRCKKKNTSLDISMLHATMIVAILSICIHASSRAEIEETRRIKK